jgi:hypothetical protein
VRDSRDEQRGGKMDLTERSGSPTVARQLAIGLALVASLAWLGCGGDDVLAPPVPARVVVSPEAVVVDHIGATQRFEARVADEGGEPIRDAQVTWSSSDPVVATVNSATGLARAEGAGIATITATVGAVWGDARFEVQIPPNPQYYPGQTYFGRNDYVEYMAGDLPIVLSAPHGGYLKPAEIPDRTWGITGQDRRTQELARAISDAIHERTGHYAHIIICHLHRSKLDANREIVEAAQGNSHARQTWSEYHDFIDSAKQAAAMSYGRGFYMDLHGHGHEFQRLELGYLLSSSDLSLTDEQLEQAVYIDRSSIRTLALEADVGFAALLRGSTSLGGLLAERGIPGVPSPTYPNPGGQPYYNGGYNTRRHGSRDGGPISGVQIEAHWSGVRDSDANREEFAVALAESLELYIEQHFNIEVPGATVLARVPAAELQRHY